MAHSTLQAEKTQMEFFEDQHFCQLLTEKDKPVFGPTKNIMWSQPPTSMYTHPGWIRVETIPFGAKLTVRLEVTGDIIHLDGGKSEACECGHRSWLADTEWMPMLALITLLQAIFTLLYKQASCLSHWRLPIMPSSIYACHYNETKWGSSLKLRSKLVLQFVAVPK